MNTSKPKPGDLFQIQTHVYRILPRGAHSLPIEHSDKPMNITAGEVVMYLGISKLDGQPFPEFTPFYTTDKSTFFISRVS